MAITVAQLGTDEPGAGGSSKTLSWSASDVNSGDVIVIMFSGGGSNVTVSSTPTGYTLISEDDDNTINNFIGALYAKVSDGTETGVTWSTSGNLSGGGIGIRVRSDAGALTLSDVFTSAPSTTVLDNFASATSATVDSMTNDNGNGNAAFIAAIMTLGTSGGWDNTWTNGFTQLFTWEGSVGNSNTRGTGAVATEVVTSETTQGTAEGWTTSRQGFQVMVVVEEPAAGAISGTATPTQGADTSTASGTHTAPTYTGTATPTQTADVSAGSGRFVYPAFFDSSLWYPDCGEPETFDTSTVVTDGTGLASAITTAEANLADHTRIFLASGFGYDDDGGYTISGDWRGSGGSLLIVAERFGDDAWGNPTLSGGAATGGAVFGRSSSGGTRTVAPVVVDGSTNVTIRGIRHEGTHDASNEGRKHCVYVKDSDHVKIEACSFSPDDSLAETVSDADTVQIDQTTDNDCSQVWIKDCLFDEKSTKGAQLYINRADDGAQNVQSCTITGNLFYRARSTVTSNHEPVRLGHADATEKLGNHLLEGNLTYQASADDEIWSIKADWVVVRYNRFFECSALDGTGNGALNNRRGDHTRIYGNHFDGNGVAGTGGVTVDEGEGVWVVFNYFDDLASTSSNRPGGIICEVQDAAAEQVIRPVVAYNTLSECGRPVRFGRDRGGSFTFHPLDPRCFNNFIVNETRAMNFEAIDVVETGVGTYPTLVSGGNWVYFTVGSGSVGDDPNLEGSTDPTTTTNTDGFLIPDTGSPLLSAADLDIDGYVKPEVRTDDFQGQTLDASPNIGALAETGTPVWHVITLTDVGPDVELNKGTATPTEGADTSTASGTHVGPTISGTATPTEGADVSAASGTHTDPTYTGTASPTQTADVSAASGTHVAPTFTAIGTPTEGADVPAAAGTHVAPVFTATAAPTQGADTSTAAGTFVAPTITGTATPTQSPDVSTAAGTHDPPTYTGTASPTQGADTSAAAGTHTDPTFTATGTPTQTADTSVASGTFVPDTISGTATPTEGADVSTAAGTHTAPTYTATAAPTQPADTSTASGTFTLPTFTATATPTEGADVSAASGTFVTGTFTGTATPTQTADTSAAAGTFVPETVTATATPTQGADVSTAAGTHVGPSFTGTSGTTDNADVSAATGTFTVPVFTATATPTQTADVSAASGMFVPAAITGTATPTEDADVSAASGVFTFGVPGQKRISGKVQLATTTEGATSTGGIEGHADNA